MFCKNRRKLWGNMNRMLFCGLSFLAALFINNGNAMALQMETLKYDPKIQEVVDELYECGAIKFGKFILKSGVESDYYIDLRRTISRPKLLERISKLLSQKAKSIPCDAVCGVPYAALALTTTLSLQQSKPMLMARKELKDHGTKQMVEGIYQAGDRVLIVEDVVTSGGSIAEIAKTLNNEGLIVRDAVVFLDRDQGGIQGLAEQGINVHPVLSISELFAYLEYSKAKRSTPKLLSYAERAVLAKHPMGHDLFLLMEEKKTNLAVAADMSDKQKLLEFADAIGPYICIFKTHADIIEGFDDEFIHNLRTIANKHHFFLFEDRKFADIGNTVIMQYKGGVHKIASWANMINAHTLPGPSIIKALKEVSKENNAALILIPQLSSLGAFTDDSYAEKTVDLARYNSDFVIGFIARKRLAESPDFLYLTPGVNLTSTGDQLGQQYLTPHEAIVNNGSDIIIVGRGLYETNDIKGTAEQYRSAGWNAYLERIKKY
jgi:uridine monophosphate synthetase